MKDAVLRWIAGDLVLLRSRALAYAWVTIAVVSLSYAFVVTRDMTHSLRTTKPPPPLPKDAGDVRFGLPLATRKDVFRELAAAEPNSRAEGKKSFPGTELAWSAEDHRGAFERKTVASISASRGLSITVVYLILDEGIRAKWPGPDGEPLTPFTVPLHP